MRDKADTLRPNILASTCSLLGYARRHKRMHSASMRGTLQRFSNTTNGGKHSCSASDAMSSLSNLAHVFENPTTCARASAPEIDAAGRRIHVFEAEYDRRHVWQDQLVLPAPLDVQDAHQTSQNMSATLERTRMLRAVAVPTLQEAARRPHVQPKIW